eukprot:601763_1
MEPITSSFIFNNETRVISMGTYFFRSLLISIMESLPHSHIQTYPCTDIFALYLSSIRWFNVFNHKCMLLFTLIFIYCPTPCHSGSDLSPVSLTGSISCRNQYTSSTSFSTQTHYYSFSHTPSQYSSNTLMFDTCASSYDTFLYLYRDDTTIWTWIAEGNNDGDCGSQEQLMIANAPTGNYVLGVSGHGGAYGTYQLVIYCGSNHKCGSEITGSTSADYDIDYYRVTLSLPTIAMANQYTSNGNIPAILFNGCTGGTGTDYDSVLYLYDTDYNELAFNDDSDHCPNTESQLNYTDLAPGDYILGIGGYSSTDYGTYTIQFVCFEPYDVCVDHSSSSYVLDGVYKWDHYDDRDVGAVYYSSALHKYIYPHHYGQNGRYYIHQNYTNTFINAKCDLGNVVEQGYVFDLDDCIGDWEIHDGSSWVTDPDMTVANCQEVCSYGHYDASMDGVYFYDHFDITLRGAVYYCSLCGSGGMYLYSLINNNRYYWMFGTVPGVTSWLSSCDVTDYAIAAGASYVFKLKHCADRWMSWNGTHSVSMSINSEICYATLAPTSAPSMAPSHAPTFGTLSPSDAPSAPPTLAPTTAPTIAPTPSTPTTSPTFTNTYVYVRQSGCDYGYCTDFGSDYDVGCSSNLNEFDADLFTSCCSGPTPSPLPAVISYAPTCQSIDYSWQCFVGVGGYPNATGCTRYDANGVFDIGAGVWHFPFQINFDDNNVIIQGQSNALTTLNYVGEEPIWITCRWPKCWICLKHLTIASNRTATSDTMFSMPNGGTLHVENVLFDGDNYVANQNGAFWNFFDPLVEVEFDHCNFVNNNAFYAFTNGVNALFYNCTFYDNTISGFTATQAMFYIDDAHVTFDGCRFISNVHNQRSLFTVLNGGGLVVSDCVFVDNTVVATHSDNKLFYAFNSSLNITQTSFIRNTGFHDIFDITNGFNIYFDSVHFDNNSNIRSIITAQSTDDLWRNDAFECVLDNATDIRLIATSFTANDVSYLLDLNGTQMYIDDNTQFTDNNCNQTCIRSIDSSLNMNGDTKVFDQGDVFVVFAHELFRDTASSLCIRNVLSTAANPYFSCINCNTNNTNIIFDECSNPYSIPSHVTFSVVPDNSSSTHSHVYTIVAQRVGQRLTCAGNVTFCEIHCNALVSCFASTITSHAVITNVLCQKAYSCQNAEMRVIANNSGATPSRLHVICSGDSACQENTIVAKGHSHFELDCVTTGSCVDSLVNISNTNTSSINCYAYGACDNLIIYTDNDNTTFLFYQYSDNVHIHNALGYTESNLQCGATNAYITLDDDHNTISSAVFTLFTSDIPNSFSYYGPCDSIQFTCNHTSQCTMSSSLTRADTEPDFMDFYECYGKSYYKDISNQHCVGSRECGGPTQSPTAAPSFSPTQHTTSPTSAPSMSPTSDPTAAPTVSPTAAPSYSPSTSPSTAPTSPPTTAPSRAPSLNPTLAPTTTPSASPSAVPSIAPTMSPSTSPTMTPSAPPTLAPSSVPTRSPSSAPSAMPTSAPTTAPSAAPSFAPSDSPTYAPSDAPSLTPTLTPTSSPTFAPTDAPTLTPSASPSIAPTIAPSAVPSASPTLTPTSAPTISPTTKPTSSPSKSPTLSPVESPTTAPSTSPTLAPSATPSASPTIAPTPIPTRQPTVAKPYDSFIDLIYGLEHVSPEYIKLLVRNAVNITNQIRLFVEWGYAVDDHLVVDFDDFWVQILQINEFIVEDIVDKDKVALSKSRQQLEISATMKCNEAICYHIMDNYDQSAFEESVTDHIRTYFAAISRNQNADQNEDENDSDKLVFVVLSSSLPMELYPPDSKATNYVFIVTTAMVILLVIVSFWAAIYNSWKCCNIPGFSNVDDGRWGALMIFALQFWDFVSDVNLAIEILSNNLLTTHMLVLISGVGSVTFVLVPYLANLIIAVRIKNLVKRNEAAKAWFQQNTAVFTILVVLSGGCYPALAVVSSNIFGLRMTSCGLTQYELKQMGKIKILGTILLENLPQLVCQALYSLAIGAITQTVALAFVASFLSVTASSLSYLIDRDSSDTPPAQYYLITRRVEQLIEPNAINQYDGDDDDVDEMNLTTAPYTAIQTVGTDSMDIIYAQTPDNDDGANALKDEEEPKYMIRVTSASTATPSPSPNVNSATDSNANTTGNCGDGEGVSAVTTGSTRFNRIASRRDASLTHDKTDITAEQRRKFLNNRGRTYALGEEIAEVFAIPPKNIEVGYSNITKKGIITHIVHYVYEEDLESISAEHLEVSPQMFTEQLCIAMGKQLTSVFIKHFGLTKGEFETNYSHKKRNRRLTVQTEQDDVVQVEKKKKVMKRLSHQIQISQNIELAQLRKLHMPPLDELNEVMEEEESLGGRHGIYAHNEEVNAKRAIKRLFSSRGVLRADKQEQLNMMESLLNGINEMGTPMTPGVDDYEHESKDSEQPSRQATRNSDRYSKSDETNLLEYMKEPEKMNEDDTLRYIASSDTDDVYSKDVSTQL